MLAAVMFAKVYPLAATSKDATVRQPKELVCFSRDGDNEIHIDDSELRYYYLPNSELDTPGGIDLQGGFGNFKKNPNNDVGELAGLLKAVESYERTVGNKIPVNIITWRGLMRQLMMLPYENRDKVVLNVVIFDGQLFIQADALTIMASRKIEESTLTELHRRQIFSGYKFEAISTLESPWAQCSRKHIEKRSKKTVSNIEQYSTVVRTTIGRAKLLLGAEVDCAWDYKPDHHDIEEGQKADPLRHYVELKTTGVVDSPNACSIFEKKLLKTWTQCFLVGIPKVIYGFRDNNLILRSVEQFNTEEIPLLLRDGPFQRSQQGSQQRPINKCMHCLKFFSGLINWIAENIPKNDEAKTYRIEYDPVANKNYINVRENEEEHRDVVLKVYRALLKNALHLELPLVDYKGRANLLDRVRKSFRKQKQVNNSLVCQELLRDAMEWNNIFYQWYEEKPSDTDPKYLQLVRAVHPKKVEDEVELHGISLLIQNDKKQSIPSEEEILSKIRERKLNSWIKLYIERRQEKNLLPRKTKLDAKYVKEILKSKVLYERRKKILYRVSAKLHRPSTAGLKCVNGTFNDITVIYTPWNSRVFTEKGNFIYKQRKRHDQYLLDLLDYEEYRKKWINVYKDEMEWEDTVEQLRGGYPRKDRSWMELFQWYEDYLSAISRDIERDTITYNKRQYCYYEKLKPQFEEMYADSKKNMKRLMEVVKRNEVGPYTDAVGEDLGQIMKEHGFKDPSDQENDQ
ncbi:hypothetical protein FOA43_003148 [Brettanomyces nanus]|uniref:Decapping nuclease n=1 Tax=Eeniella nana TaxID=13502 RepID=A0A875RVS8_EENNA|nr:uncharacterized protein FOA43_003148 [Brettanomyces nanus]QPG75787.1 hypothetical protein FOA43_003148 [Brettanomyces nanus]